ncbi:hypothetical protein ABZT47_05645 [Sphaerisporangium sp. NPDC005289]|uniref:hypothetical protein n=1 Tax=Sphaerisporangium sp. NPDC005289 TaxID=3155247 RepID=UPI00339FFA8D
MNESELRTLLVRATEDRPAGIDLMPVTTRAPRRARSLVPVIATAGVAATVGTTVLVLLGGQPSAQAQVAAAVDNTSKESYRIHGDSGAKAFDGAFDPVRRVGVVNGRSGGGTDTIFIGDRMYIREAGAAKWHLYPRDQGQEKGAPAATALVKLAPQDPQAALQKLRSATDVHEDGTASGTGWTGRRFTFSLKDQKWTGPAGASKESFDATGSVEVDDQGRVRRLEVTFSDNGQRDVIDFADFGTPVTVTAPPADQVEQKPGPDPDDKPTGKPGDPTRKPGDPGKPDDKPVDPGQKPSEEPSAKKP